MSLSFARLIATFAFTLIATLGNNLMAAGNVNATFVNGQLKLTGDGNANAVFVVNTVVFVKFAPFPIVKVTGAGGTTINNKSSVNFARPTNGVFADMKGGNDELAIGIPGTPSTFAGNTIIEMGTGTDVFFAGDVTFLGDASVHTGGSGNDKVFFANTDVQGALSIETDSGDDLVSPLTDADSIVIKTNGGNDVTGFALGVVSGNVSIDTGNGTDDVQIVDAEVDGLLAVTPGAGADTGLIETVIAGALYFDMNLNDDKLTAEDVLVVTDAVLDGGAGTDVLTNNGIDADILEIDSF